METPESEKKMMELRRRKELLLTDTTEGSKALEKSLATTFDQCGTAELSERQIDINDDNSIIDNSEEEGKLMEKQFHLDKDKERTNEMTNRTTSNEVKTTEMKQSSLSLKSLSAEEEEEQKKTREKKQFSHKRQLTTNDYDKVKLTTNYRNTINAVNISSSLNNSKMSIKMSKKSNLHNPWLKFHTLPLKKQFDRIEREFTVLEQQTMNPRRYKFTTSFKYAALNRYINIFANEETLFPAKKDTNNFAVLGSESRQNNEHVGMTIKKNNNDNNDDEYFYINGNLVDLKVQPLFVASQAPVVDGFYAFWRTIYHHKISLILMLTQLDEGGLVKADRYWPEEGEEGNDTNSSHNVCTMSSEAKIDSTAFTSVTSKTLTFGDITISTDPSEPSWYDNTLHLFYRPLLVTLNSCSNENNNCCHDMGKSNIEVENTSHNCCSIQCDNNNIDNTNQSNVNNKKSGSSSSSSSSNNGVNATNSANCDDCEHKEAECNKNANCNNISLSNGTVHRVMHVQYTGWPDQGVPHTTASFEALLNEIKQYVGKQSACGANTSVEPSKDYDNTSDSTLHKNDIKSDNTPIIQNSINRSNVKLSPPPVLVHCSAGIGRTGTLIGAYAAIALLEQDKLTDSSMMHIVSTMRRARYGMVQRIEQYMFMYQIVMHYMGIDVNDFAASLTCRAEDYYYQMMYNRSMSKRERSNCRLR